MAKLLIIEDDKTLLNLLKRKLEKEGYDLEIAEDGEEGLTKIKEENPDLVLLDIIMPKKSGFDVLRAMSQEKETKDIPVIIISNSGQPVEIEKAKETGPVVDYLIKADFTPAEVSTKVKDYLDKNFSESESSDNPKKNTSKKETEESSSADQENKENKKNKENSTTSILLVEDDRFLRNILVKKFEDENFRVAQAIDGKKALTLLEEENPKLILLDLILPGMSGYDVLKKIKEKEETKDIPVIILSNLGQKDEIDKGLSLGAKHFLVKAHFTPDEIVEKVRETLNEG